MAITYKINGVVISTIVLMGSLYRFTEDKKGVAYQVCFDIIKETNLEWSIFNKNHLISFFKLL